MKRLASKLAPLAVFVSALLLTQAAIATVMPVTWWPTCASTGFWIDGHYRDPCSDSGPGGPNDDGSGDNCDACCSNGCRNSSQADILTCKDCCHRYVGNDPTLPNHCRGSASGN